MYKLGCNNEAIILVWKTVFEPEINVSMKQDQVPCIVARINKNQNVGHSSNPAFVFKVLFVSTSIGRSMPRQGIGAD